MVRARSSAPIDRIEPSFLDEVERAVRTAGALPNTKLTKVKLTKEAHEQLLRELPARGLERLPTIVRVPIEAQILALLKGGGRLPLKDLAKRVKGASKAELSAAIEHLSRAAKARLVVRTQVEVLVGASDKVLDPKEIAALAKLSAQLAKVLKKVSAKGTPRTLLREDLAALLAPLGAAATPASPTPEDARTRVDGAIARLSDPLLGLVRIPDLVRALASDLSLADIHRALGEAADSGALELRPEAGGEFLDAADAALCPPGPRGTVFSYARRVHP